MTNFLMSCLVSAVWIFGSPPTTQREAWIKNIIIFVMGAGTMAAYNTWQAGRKAKLDGDGAL